MNRITLIKEIFQKTDFKNYLEIGCRDGHSFLRIKAKYKMAVDPCFKISKRRKIKWLFKVPQNINNKYFEEKSDDFYLKRKAHLNKIGQLDVVLVDGLHTFRASLKDVLNSLKYLNNSGIIIMHDCLPPNMGAALPTKDYPNEEEQNAVEGWTGEWCGDVWKTIVYLRKNLLELIDTCVIDTDYGLGIVRPKGKIENGSLIIDEKSFSDIDKLGYDELIQDTKSMLNLKSSDYTKTIIENITNHKNK